MTPAEYDAHVSAWYRRERREQRRTAVLAALLVNTHRGKGSQAANVEDFMDGFAEEEIGVAAR